MHQAAAQPQNRFEKITRWIGLFVLAPVLLTLALPAILQLPHTPDLGFAVHRIEILSVEAGGPADAAGLREGDFILRVRNRPVESMTDFHAALAGVHGRGAVSFTVRRGDRELDFLVHPASIGQSRLIRGYSIWMTGLTFLSIGWWVLWKRPDPAARNFFALSLIFAFFLLDIPNLDNSWYMEGKDLARTLLQFLLPAYFLRFFLQFPVPLRSRTGGRSLARPLLIPAYLLSIVSWHQQITNPGSRIEEWIGIIGSVYSLVFFVAGLIIFARRIFRRDRPIMHTKMIVILVGLLVGLLPFLAALFGGNVYHAVPQWQYLTFSLILIPASFGLAILRYGALDKAFVVRVGLIYGLLTLLVLVAYFLVVFVLGHLLSRAFRISMEPVILLLVAAAGLAVLPLRRSVQAWIDRTFYPRRRANRQTMGRLAEDLTELIDTEEVIRTITARLEELYRPRSFAFFLADDGAPPAYRAWHDPTAPLPADSALVGMLDRIRRPVFAEEIEDQLLAGEADEESLKLSADLRAALLVPLVTGNRLIGFTAFGPKDGGELYGQEDLTLLRSLMMQAASLIESRQLYKESLHQRVLEKELEVARDIQARMLPREPLSAEEFTIAGLNESCRQVGGDYFDYFLRQDGSLGFAIADVAGKGVPAAMQMTTLRAAFRNLAETAFSPAAVISELNEGLGAEGASGQFVCFFFGIWNPLTNLLTYCNAGMDPPVLFRSDTKFHQQLRKGGPVLGVNPEFDYREGNLALQAGDQLFLYTDGLTEAVDAEDRLFTAERLLACVENDLESAPLQLLRNIFDQINEYGGSEKSDDKTAILLEINV